MKMAKDAGFKYVVFVTKHHDGFCMWPSKMTGYTIANTPFKRDICREIADAAHKYGIKLGWSYSTRDWTNLDYLKGDNKKYNDYYESQVQELLANYGKVDIIWFDHVAGNWHDYGQPCDGPRWTCSTTCPCPSLSSGAGRTRSFCSIQRRP